MIDQDSFIRELDKVCKMMGHRLTREVAVWIYEKLGRVHEDDFYKAMDDFLREGERPTFNNIERHVNRRRYLREEREARDRSTQETNAVKEMLRSGREQTCSRDKHCHGCPLQGCRIVGKAAIKGLIAIGSGQKSADQVNREMAREFPGAGYEQSVAENTF